MTNSARFSRITRSFPRTARTAARQLAARLLGEGSAVWSCSRVHLARAETMATPISIDLYRCWWPGRGSSSSDNDRARGDISHGPLHGLSMSVKDALPPLVCTPLASRWNFVTMSPPVMLKWWLEVRAAKAIVFAKAICRGQGTRGPLARSSGSPTSLETKPRPGRIFRRCGCSRGHRLTS